MKVLNITILSQLIGKLQYESENTATLHSAKNKPLENALNVSMKRKEKYDPSLPPSSV